MVADAASANRKDAGKQLDVEKEQQANDQDQSTDNGGAENKEKAPDAGTHTAKTKSPEEASNGDMK